MVSVNELPHMGEHQIGKSLRLVKLNVRAGVVDDFQPRVRQCLGESRRV